MYPSKNESNVSADDRHVFRMIGNRDDVSRACKSTLAAAGFTQFTSYGNRFVCSRQMDINGFKLMLYVQIELLSHELCEVTFERTETSMPTLHRQLINNKLNRIQSALEVKAA